jgi:signal peptidase I
MATPAGGDLFRDPEPPELSGQDAPTSHRTIIEWVLVVAGAVVVALLIKTFVLQAFYIPSESMSPTLLVGDRVLVNKLSYHLHDVNRGDVVVFERPPGETNDQVKDLIKRVIGLPGDSITFGPEDHRVYVNGKVLDEPWLQPGVETKPKDRETSYSHLCSTDDPCEVPAGNVWVMGDNRTNSEDSRYFGPISQDLIVGRAFVIVWPLNRFGGI